MQYDLVFEGGGAKGTVFVGALRAFEERGHTTGRLMGTSAGAITAALLAAGYDSAEILEAVGEKEGEKSVFSTFMGIPEVSPETVKGSLLHAFLDSVDIPFLPDRAEKRVDEWIMKVLLRGEKYRQFFSFIEEGGLYSADSFLKWMQRKLDSGTFNGQPRQFSHMSLKELYDVTEKDLTVIAADTLAKRVMILNHRTAPNCPVVWAVRMSMSIPFVWQEVTWQEAWGTYREKEIAGNTIVDGGILSNFPIALFISSDPITQDVMGKKRHNNVLGMLIDEAEPIEGIPIEPEKVSKDTGFTRTKTRVERLVNTLTQGHDILFIEQFSELVVRLPSKGVDMLEFDMSDDKRTHFVNAGYQTMMTYFNENTSMVLSGSRGPSKEVRQLAESVSQRLLGD